MIPSKSLFHVFWSCSEFELRKNIMKNSRNPWKNSWVFQAFWERFSDFYRQWTKFAELTIPNFDFFFNIEEFSFGSWPLKKFLQNLFFLFFRVNGLKKEGVWRSIKIVTSYTQRSHNWNSNSSILFKRIKGHLRTF